MLIGDGVMLVHTFSGCFSEYFSIHTLSCSKDSGILFIVNISCLIQTLLYEGENLEEPKFLDVLM